MTEAATGERAVEALARILDPEAFAPSAAPREVGLELHRHDRRKTAVVAASRALAAGYRLVSDDPQSVERVARAMRDADALAHDTADMTLVPWRQLDGRNKRWYRAKARVAVAALRSGQESS